MTDTISEPGVRSAAFHPAIVRGLWISRRRGGKAGWKWFPSSWLCAEPFFFMSSNWLINWLINWPQLVYQWKYEFSKEVLSSLTELTLTAESPQYQTVLDLDRKVRGKTLPKHLNVFMSSEDQRYTPSTYMRGCLLAQYRTVGEPTLSLWYMLLDPSWEALLYIHRSFFAQALLDHPDNPLKSPYAPSLLAAYRCASGVIKANLNHFERFPDLCYRWWSIWTHGMPVICLSLVNGWLIGCKLAFSGAVSNQTADTGNTILIPPRLSWVPLSRERPHRAWLGVHT